MKYRNYRDYLASADWLILKSKYILRIIKNKLPVNCLLCSSTTNLVVHHSSYKNLYKKEEIDDLELLCSNCHEKLHFSEEFRVELGDIMIGAMLQK